MSEKVDFDKHADTYDKVLQEGVSFFGEESSYFAEYKIKIVKDTLTKQPTDILEYGCGIGRNIKFLKSYFPDSEVTGCDISRRSLEIAEGTNPEAKFFKIEDTEITKRENRYDMVFISCVFHHIEPHFRNEAVKNINRLLKTGGCVYFFEHNPYNPITRHIVNTCPWDTDAILLRPKESKILFSDNGFNLKQFRYCLYFPSIFGFLRAAEKYIGFIPLGGQYYIKTEKV